MRRNWIATCFPHLLPRVPVFSRVCGNFDHQGTRSVSNLPETRLALGLFGMYELQLTARACKLAHADYCNACFTCLRNEGRATVE